MSDISEILGVRPLSPVRALGARTNAPKAHAAAAVYRSTKTYGHSEGLSCCFRQWRAAHSHCRLLHGYALSFRFVFASQELDERNWCFDFGGLKPVRAWLHHMFDHTALVAEDDPQLPSFHDLADRDLIDLRVQIRNLGDLKRFFYSRRNRMVGHFEPIGLDPKTINPKGCQKQITDEYESPENSLSAFQI